LSVTLGIGGSTGGPIVVVVAVSVPAPIAILDVGVVDAGTGAGAGASAGTGATVEPGSVRLMRSPEISSSRTASHAQRMSRAHSRTSGYKMRKWSSWTTRDNERTVVAKKARVSVDPVEAVAIVGVAVAAAAVVVVEEDDREKGGDGKGETGRAEGEGVVG
jgi:hypothetical protein